MDAGMDAHNHTRVRGRKRLLQYFAYVTFQMHRVIGMCVLGFTSASILYIFVQVGGWTKVSIVYSLSNVILADEKWI